MLGPGEAEGGQGRVHDGGGQLRGNLCSVAAGRRGAGEVAGVGAGQGAGRPGSEAMGHGSTSLVHHYQECLERWAWQHWRGVAGGGLTWQSLCRASISGATSSKRGRVSRAASRRRGRGGGAEPQAEMRRAATVHCTALGPCSSPTRPAHRPASPAPGVGAGGRRPDDSLDASKPRALSQ